MVCALDLREHLFDGSLSLVGCPQVLCTAVIGLNARKAQCGLGGNGTRQRHGRFAGLGPAAVLADVDFHEHIDGGSARLYILHGLGQTRHAFFAVHANGQTPAFCIQGLGQRRHACQLERGDDFVADEDIGDAARSQGFGLADFLHAVAYGSRVLQQMRDVCRFMQFGVGPPQHAMLLGKAHHALDIAVHGVQVDDQGGRVYAFDGLTDQGLQMLRNVLHLGCLAEGVRYLPSLPKTGHRVSRAGD